jgi:hypothetical protein
VLAANATYLGGMPRHLRPLLGALLLLALAAPAAGAAPGDRTSAAGIRQATIDLHVYVVAQTPAIEAAFGAFETPPCQTALKGMPDGQAAEVLIEFVLPAALEMELTPIQPAMNAFVAKLDTIAMRDAKLRSGRAAWRVLAAEFGKIAPAPTDVCQRLDAWRQAGYPAASRPTIEDPGVDALLRVDDKRFDRLDAKLGRAGERLRDLGVSKRVVEWYTGDTLLDGIDLPDSIIEGSDDS